MTPPLSIDSLVEIVGPSNIDSFGRLGETFRISLIDGKYYSTCGMPWYPASSLRLVEEELKIGDFVEVIRPDLTATGKIMEVARVELPSHDNKHNIQLDDKSWWRPVRLRKLTPVEVVMHTGTIGYKMQDEVAKAKDAVRKILVPLVNERLSPYQESIEETQRSMVALEDRVSAIEKEDWQKSIDVLMGERPEVCDCPNGHQIPNGEPIHIVIVKGDKMHTWCDTCPAECLAWCEKALDSMREG